jgi:Xaa-Pro aminopeptidase
MEHLADLNRAALAAGLTECGADGWLLFDFKGCNPIALRMLGLKPGTRRLFVYLPKNGAPVALVHKIEMQPFEGFQGNLLSYARWQELEAGLKQLVGGKIVAMEISHRDAVPYLDRVPSGVVELIREAGAKVVSSSPLVTRLTARWNESEAEDHIEAAEVLAAVAKQVMGEILDKGGTGLREYTVQQRVIELMEKGGLTVDPGHLPIIGFGPNAANPHYEPHEGQDRALEKDEVVLIDLFAGKTLETVMADQTWMGFSGKHPPAEVEKVWTVVRDARDAALKTVWSAIEQKRPLLGYQIDRAARDVIEAAGYGEYFVHRTGHSIDRDLHGSGPHCDDYETRDDRQLVPGVGFSVEPGVYLTGKFGVRSEVNVYWSPAGPVLTPREAQVNLLLPR